MIKMLPKQQLRSALSLVVITLMVALLTGQSTARADNTVASQPNPELAPDQVIKIVIDALKTNDPEQDDDGIATVFNFASPGNKTVTGPLPRFKSMIKRGFGNMLNHVKSEYGEIEISNDKALQAVWLTDKQGNETGYVFQMGKQQSGEFTGMWMTESVWPIGSRKPKGQSI